MMRKSWKWLLALVIVLSVGFIWLQLSPSIRVSKQTTVIEGPLREDGLPNYEAYLLQRDAEGVTPKNNAAVLLWQALWPGELPVGDRQRLLEALEIESLDPQDRLAPLISDEWSDPLTTWLDDPDPDVTIDFILEAGCRPWREDAFPLLAEWVAQNKRPLDLIVEATARPRFWSPSPTHLNDDYDELLETLLPVSNGLRSASRGLAVRAMGNVGEGRLREAWRDTLANYRLARLIGQSLWAVERLVGYAIEGHAARQTIALLSHPDTDVELASQIHLDLQSLAPAAELSDVYDRGERLCYVELVLAVANGRSDSIDLPMWQRKTTDWNLVLQEGNAVFDRLVVAVRERERVRRDQLLGELESDLVSRESRPRRLTLTSRRARSLATSGILVSTIIPTYFNVVGNDDRFRVEMGLTLTAAKLAGYQAEHGEYPEQLADAIDPAPIDWFSGEPFVYRLASDGGYILYSVGPDGGDDGGDRCDGRIVDGEWAATPEPPGSIEEGDLVIRVPVPRLEKPTPHAAD